MNARTPAGRWRGITVLAAAIVAAGSFAAAHAATLTGTVTASDTGGPVAGAVVIVRGTDFMATSASDGTYRVDSLPDGTYGLACDAPGYMGRSTNAVWLSGDVVRDFTLDLPAEAGLVTGVVTCGQAPCAGAWVQALQGSSVRAQAISRPGTGGYSLSGLAAGDYTIRALKIGHLPAEAQVSISEPGSDAGSSSATADLALQPAGPFTVSGLVALSDNPLDKSGSRVRLNGAIPELSATTSTGGLYTLGGVPAGPVSITATHDGYQASTRIDFLMQSDRTLDFVLLRPEEPVEPDRFTLSGRVTLEIPDGGPPVLDSDTVVSVWSEGGDYRRQVRAAGDGSYRIGGIPKGRYRAGASREGFVPAVSDPFDLDADRTMNFTLVQDPEYDWGPGELGQKPGCGCTGTGSAAGTAGLLMAGLLSLLWWRRRCRW